MNLVDLDFLGKPRRPALCDHFATISEPWLGPKDQASPLGASARPRLRKSASGFAARPRNAL
jgi:hypothetical protein